MAKVSFDSKPIGAIETVDSVGTYASVSDSGTRVSLKDLSLNASSIRSGKVTARTSYDRTNATPASVLPFRVKFTNVGIVGYNPDNPAPVGIAVIGLSNYIL